VQWFKGVPSPVKNPQLVDMVIFRENTEDIYAGIEFKAFSSESEKIISFLKSEFGSNKIRFPSSSAIGIKPISKEGTERLIRAAIEFAVNQKRKSLSIIHKGNIMKFTEGAFCEWGYSLAKSEFRDKIITQKEVYILQNKDENKNITDEENARLLESDFDFMSKDLQNNLIKEVNSIIKELYASCGDGQYKNRLLIKDVIADIALQQVLTRPTDFDVIASMNLNGDYLSDALAAQVGGIGIAPGGNINYLTGHAIFEATHGTAPKYADQDKVNPLSLILSAEMMLRYLAWDQAADLIITAINKTIEQKKVTYDFHRLMPNATLLKCSEFAQELVKNMEKYP